jgi:hypothetical protein
LLYPCSLLAFSKSFAGLLPASGALDQNTITIWLGCLQPLYCVYTLIRTGKNGIGHPDSIFFQKKKKAAGITPAARFIGKGWY